jgi:hypothetical protein
MNTKEIDHMGEGIMITGQSPTMMEGREVIKLDNMVEANQMVTMVIEKTKRSLMVEDIEEIPPEGEVKDVVEGIKIETTSNRIRLPSNLLKCKVNQSER